MLSLARRSAVTLCALSILALFALPAAARAGVIVVDISGGGEFTSLPAALASAVDGDTLLIRPGDYSSQATFLTISSRTVTIAADGTGPVITPPLRVTDGEVTHRVLLRGLRASAAQSDFLNSGLEIIGAYEVFVESCEFAGKVGVQTPDTFAPCTPGRGGIYVLLGHAVIKDCIAQGGKGADTIAPNSGFPSWGGPGVDSQLGSVQVYGGSLTGGKGGDVVGFPTGVGTFPNTGGPGIAIGGEGCFVAGATLTGGDGGDGDDLEHFPYQHKGGDALTASGAGTVEMLGVTLVPGQGGFDGADVQGAAGQATLLTDGAVLVTDPGPFRDYALGPPTPEGSALQFHYAGVPGDAVGIFLSLGTGTLPLPAKQGVWHLGAPTFGPYVFFAPSGTLSLNIPVPGVGLGPDGALLLYEQVFVKPASGPALLSSPTTHLIVDGSL